MRAGPCAVTSFSSIVLHTVAFRHTSPGRPPLSGSGSQRFGGRWNRPGHSAAIYLADLPQTCIAEFRRMAVGQGRGPASLLPRDLHHITLDEIRVADLTTPECLAETGLRPADIAAPDWSKCQQIGEAVALTGLGGLRAPSATGIGHVIVLFESNLPAGRVRVIQAEQLDLYL